MAVLVLIGTRKGGFLLRSNDSRSDWSLEGPVFPGWKVTAAARAPDGRYLVATGSDVYGAAVQRGTDLESWEQTAPGPVFPEGGERRLKNIWTIVAAAGGTLLAGVDDAGLFRSDDVADSWQPVAGLNDHPTAPRWSPGFGGLAAHSILTDPSDPSRIWCGISAVGVFRSDDGGATWHSKNAGVTAVAADPDTDEIGYCVHALAAHPGDAGRIYRQDHSGVYRTSDGGDTWERAEEGLSAVFGFAIAMDPHSGTLFVVPQLSDEFRYAPDGELAVWRSTDGADTWTPVSRGLPQQHAYTGVLRGALAVDGLRPAGVYLGTTAGTVHVSPDGGDTWTTFPWVLPRILTVDVLEAD